MASRRPLHHLLCVLAGVALATLPTYTPAQADDVRDSMGRVPELGGFKLSDANHALRRRGLKVGTVYEISRERMYAYVLKYGWDKRVDPNAASYIRSWPRGRVFMQNPKPGQQLKTGAEVDVILSASRDGRLPPLIQALQPKALPAARPAPAPTAPAPTPGVTERRPEPPTGIVSGTGTPPRPPPPQDPVPARPRDEPAPMTPPAESGGSEPMAPPAEAEAPTERQAPFVTERTPASIWDMRDDLPVADGSPDAPRPAPPPNRGVVPPLLGLDLNDAEMLARRSEMTLHVERVAGHPVGRVLKQWPDAESARPAGGVIKVRVTAGGDFDAEMPTAAEVYVREVQVPDLLDRTVPQATRILEAVGLRLREEERAGGLAGRVGDQKPAAGAIAHKGGIVVVYVAPGEVERGEVRPRREVASPDPVPRSVPRSPKGVPQPIAPAPGTRMPRDSALSLGFSWKPVEGATAYIVEIEEATTAGTWVASERRTARGTVLAAELVRLDTRAAQTLRWRVRAVKDGAQGTPSAWIELPAELAKE